MSTSLLYHAWGTCGYNYLSTHYEKGTIIFRVEPKPENLVCPECNSTNWIHKGHRWRTLRTLPIGPKKVFLEVKIPRMFCHDCDSLNEIDPSFADPLRTYTKALESYVAELCRLTTVKGAAKISGLKWDVVKDIDKRYLTKKYSKISLKGIRYLAFDEFAVRKGHRYMTTAVDLSKGRIIYAAKGKDREAIIPFLKRIKRSRSPSLQAIAMDMSPSYISATQELLPNISIVFDHFHVVKIINEHLDELRRRIFRTANSQQQTVLKGVRYLILMGAENLDQREPAKKERLERALAINEPLNIAYYLKEKLRKLWDSPTKEQGSEFLQKWCEEAGSSDLPELQKMVKTLRSHEK